MTIRYADEAEVEELTAIEIDADQRYIDSAHPEIANGDHIPQEALARAVAARQVVVAVEDDAILGWLLVTKSGDEICIGQISVRRSAGGKGVGSKLLDTVVASVRRAGHRSIVLNTQADVPWNQPWYERRGFVVVPPEEWTADMHVIAEEQRADGLDWTTRVHMRLVLDDAPATDSREVTLGRVKFFLSDKGWGAIVSAALPHDVWVHFSSIEAEGFRSFDEGDEVEFAYEDCWGVQDSWHYRTTWCRRVATAQ